MSKSKNGYRRVKWLFGKEIEIPEEWEIHTVESVSKKIVSGGTPSTTMLKYWNGNIPWTRSSVLLDPYLKSGERFITAEGLRNSSSVLIPKNNLLVSSRVSVGNISISAIDVAISQDVTGIIINKAYARSEFLYWYLKQHIKKLVLISQGTTIQGFTRKELAKLLVFLPSLSEQKKIASILSGVDALIESTQKVIEKTERLKKGLMQKLLTRGIGHTEFKKVKWLFGKEIEIPEEWECVSLNDLCDEIYRYPTYYNIEYVSKGIPEIRGELIKQNGSLVTSLSKYRFLSKETSRRFPRTQLVEGDFVFSVRGTMGKVALISKNFQGANITANLMRISPNQKKVVPKLLLFYFLTKSFSDVLESLSSQTTIKTIQSKDLKSMKFTIPKLSTEQQKIASILSGVDAYIQKNQQYKKKLEKLKKGLMQKLLIGQIRVKV